MQKDMTSMQSKICHVGIHWIALGEYSQSTHVSGFHTFLSFFASFCNGQIGHQQHKGKLTCPIQNDAKNLRMTETLVHGYSSESTQQELSNEYQYDRI